MADGGTSTSPSTSFELAAPEPLRRPGRVPPEVREAFKALWDGLVADINRELANGGLVGLRKPRNLRRLLDSLAVRVDDAQQVVIATAASYPMAGSDTA